VAKHFISFLCIMIRIRVCYIVGVNNSVGVTVRFRVNVRISNISIKFGSYETPHRPHLPL